MNKWFDSLDIIKAFLGYGYIPENNPRIPEALINGKM